MCSHLLVENDPLRYWDGIGTGCYTASKVEYYKPTFTLKMKKTTYRTQVIYRRVDNGQIVTEAFAKKHPNLTEREVRKIPV
jgi:O-glycosyl hydrolase